MVYPLPARHDKHHQNNPTTTPAAPSRAHLHILKARHRLIDLVAPLLQSLLRPEHRRVVLHHALHTAADLGGAQAPVGVAQRVEARDRELARVGGEGVVGGVGLRDLAWGLGVVGFRGVGV